MKRRTLESSEQRLFTCLASAFLFAPHQQDDSILVAQCNSADLLRLAQELKFPVHGSKIAFSPQLAFPPAALTQLSQLKSQMSTLHQEITALSNGKEEKEIEFEHRKYMESLHAYNEAKDAGLALLGKLAQLTGQSTRQLYPEFGLSLEE